MKSMVGIIVCAVVLALAIPSSALFGLPETLEGKIESISSNSLSIMSEKENAQQMVEIQINSETEFENAILSLDSFRKGDRVKVKYKEDGDEKIAISIVKVMDEKEVDVF